MMIFPSLGAQREVRSRERESSAPKGNEELIRWIGLLH